MEKLVTNKTRHAQELQKEFIQDGKKVAFIDANICQTFGLHYNIDQYQKVKFKTFKEEYEIMKQFIHIEGGKDTLFDKILLLYQQLEFPSFPNKINFETGWILFSSKESKVARPPNLLSEHEKMAFIVFLISQCNYDIVIIDNYYAANILQRIPKLFKNAKGVNTII